MEKSLSDRIAKRESNKKKPDGSHHKAIFLALSKEISDAIDKGWSLKIIWKTLFEEGKINFTYKTFRLYASRLILSDDSRHAGIKSTGNPLNSNASKLPKNKPVTAIPAFTFQPKPNPEELL